MVYMRHLIVGYGEVGRSLGEVLGKHMWIDLDTGSWDKEPVDVVHICIPYPEPKGFEMAVNPDFAKTVMKYKTGSNLVIVHSSVPVGVCDALGVVHSPICGVHPHLAEGIRTFVKYFGGKRAREAAVIFQRLKIPVKVYKEARITEAMKLWSTTQYGRMIMLEKEIYEWCQKNDLPFEEVYTRSNKDYNKGYTKLGMKHVVRPYLKHVPGPIGGHCVNENSKLLGVKI